LTENSLPVLRRNGGTPLHGVGAPGSRVRKTGGNRSGPAHEPVRIPPQNHAYKFLRTVNRLVSPVNRPVFYSWKPVAGGFVNPAWESGTPTSTARGVGSAPGGGTRESRTTIQRVKVRWMVFHLPSKVKVLSTVGSKGYGSDSMRRLTYFIDECYPGHTNPTRPNLFSTHSSSARRPVWRKFVHDD
jgi:hypothetical protein